MFPTLFWTTSFDPDGKYNGTQRPMKISGLCFGGICSKFYGGPKNGHMVKAEPLLELPLIGISYPVLKLNSGMFVKK
jgi:hypothetical protein